MEYGLQKPVVGMAFKQMMKNDSEQFIRERNLCIVYTGLELYCQANVNIVICADSRLSPIPLICSARITRYSAPLFLTTIEIKYYPDVC